MPRISVLVAVYNAEQYLSDCLNSLLAQTLDDIQVVCVDDCSTDHSLEMLHQYASYDSRICVYRLDHNQGALKARQEALRHATGELIAFLDSDDWLAFDALELAERRFAENPQTDCVLFRLLRARGSMVNCSAEPVPTETFSVISGREAFLKSLDWTIHGVCVARASLLRNFKYTVDVPPYDDEVLTSLHYLQSRQVAYCNGDYFYRLNPESVTNKIALRRFYILRAKERMREILKDMCVDAEAMAHFENIRWLFVIDSCKLYFTQGMSLPASDRRCAESEIRHAWRSIDRSQLKWRLKLKPGYMPMPYWWMFKLEERLFFTLKRLIGRL